MPIAFVEEYANDRDTKWDIALYSGSGSKFEWDGIAVLKERRKLEEKDGYFEVQNRQVSSGSAEAIALEENDKTKLGDKRKEIRRILPNPLLMLHILEAKEGDFAAFGISFPGDALSSGKTVSLKINTVYYNDLLKQLEEETNDE